MEQTIFKKINIAPSSSEGHFVENASQVINLDEINETFEVKGNSVLTSKNHTTLKMKDDCIITCQQVYNHSEKIEIKSKD